MIFLLSSLFHLEVLEECCKHDKKTEEVRDKVDGGGMSVLRDEISGSINVEDVLLMTSLLFMWQ